MFGGVCSAICTLCAAIRLSHALVCAVCELFLPEQARIAHLMYTQVSRAMSYLLGRAPCADSESGGSKFCWSKAFACWREHCSLAGHGPGGSPSLILPRDSVVPLVPTFPQISAGSDPSLAPSASLKIALGTEAALILCMCGWAALLQHQLVFLAPGSLAPHGSSCTFLAPCFPVHVISLLHFTLCPYMVSLAALGTRDRSCSVAVLG